MPHYYVVHCALDNSDVFDRIRAQKGSNERVLMGHAKYSRGVKLDFLIRNPRGFLKEKPASTELRYAT